MHLALQIIAAICGLLALCGLGYLVLSLYSAIRFTRHRPALADFAPPVSILKPLKGIDPDMYESFRTHCLQDYPEFEIIFGVNDPADPAVAAVEQLQREFPEDKIRLVICDDVRGTNRKVSNLCRMVREACYEHLLINDSDIRVEPDYLRRIMAPFADAKTGMVTTLYRGVPEQSIWSKTEAVTISTDFAGGVLSALVVEGGVHFALGSTLAITKTTLDKIGGMEPLLDYLADDYELGVRTSRLGLNVVLSDVVVETFLHDYSFTGMFEHQLRWARTVRDMRKWGYIGVLLTYGLPFSLLAFVFSAGAAWAWTLLAAVAVVRFVTGYFLCDRVVHDRITQRNLWLIPLRDVIGLVLWFVSFAGDTITWRGEVFHLKDGKLYRT